MPRNRSEKDTPETAALRAHLNAFVAYRDAFLVGNNFEDGVPRSDRDDSPVGEQFNRTWIELPRALRHECVSTYHVGKRIRIISSLLDCGARPKAEKYQRAKRDILGEPD